MSSGAWPGIWLSLRIAKRRASAVRSESVVAAAEREVIVRLRNSRAIATHRPPILRAITATRFHRAGRSAAGVAARNSRSACPLRLRLDARIAQAVQLTVLLSLLPCNRACERAARSTRCFARDQQHAGTAIALR